MSSCIYRFIVAGTCLLQFLCCLPASGQIDLKHSLTELKDAYKTAPNDTSKANYALLISNFYLYNKGLARQNIDTCYQYIKLAKGLSTRQNYQKGLENAYVMEVQVLLRMGKIKEARQLIHQMSGALFCRMNIEAGNFFLQKGGEDKADLLLADGYFNTAQNYAALHHMPRLYLTSLTFRYPVMLEQYLPEDKCEKYFNQVVAACKRSGQKDLEAKIWYLRAFNTFDSLRYYQQALKVAYSIKDTPTVISIRKEVADMNLRNGKTDIAGKELLQLLQMYQDIGYKNLQFTYDLLTAVFMTKANFEIAMRYGLKAITCAEATGTEIGLNYFQYRLSSLCWDMGLKRESNRWNEKCLESTIRIQNYFPYLVYRRVAAERIKEGKAKVVLKQVIEAEKKFPQKYSSNYYFVPLLKADCYAALNKPQLAEQFYLYSLKELAKRGTSFSYYYMACKNIAEFYITQKLYNKAAPYLNHILASKKPLFSITDLATAHTLMFKVDSANKNYLSGIAHFEAAKAITDSVFNQVRLKQSEQLQIQFDIGQRERENLSLKNNIELQKSELEKEALSRKLILLALLGLVLVTGLLLYLYRAKQKGNIKLTIRQQKIDKQNEQLNQLLHEKEWLMKEIHHRVKNNLQIISSLLNTQSSFLDNQEALTAIRDSQNRMQAISIVHQKLYQAEDLATIDLSKYIQELTISIQQSFEDQNNIRFEFNIDNIRLSSADTVPLGLILNEAITNSVKYAFEPGKPGIIQISLTAADEQYLKMTIRDNGRGLPKAFDAHACSSLGMNLMIGLSEQLNGHFEIFSDKGTAIIVTFQPQPEHSA